MRHCFRAHGCACPKDERSRSAGLLESLLCGVLSPEEADEFSQDMLTMSASDFVVCPDSFGQGPCRHVKEGLLNIEVAADSPQVCFARRLSALCQSAMACAACRNWAYILLSGFDNSMVSAVGALESDEEPLNDELLRGPVKRMRLDEDYIEAYHRAVAEGRASSVGALARARGGLAPRSANNLPGRWLSQYQAEGFLTFLRGDLSLALDGSRVGNPAQENEVLALWSPEADRSMALPIQATFCRSPPPEEPPRAGPHWRQVGARIGPD